MRRKSCRTAVRALLVCLLAVGIAHGETKPRWKKAWIASVGALFAANVLDARSSMGRYEANPLLSDSQGRFNTGRSVMVKSAASGGMLVLQVLLHRRMPEQRLERSSAVVNFAAAATVGATAFRNTRIH